MQKSHFIITICLCIISTPIMAATPSTSCPSGYAKITETYMTIGTTTTSCQSGSTVGPAYSCLTTQGTNYGTCIMYAPVQVDYTDSTGTYEFTSPCPMTN